METGGFSFYTEEDGRLAEAEQRKIDYLEERIDYTRPEGILHVYNKAIQERLFKTPVGFSYLKKMQDYLLHQPQMDPERVQPIPLYEVYTDPGERERGKPSGGTEKQASPGVRRKKKEKQKAMFQISVALNILLALAVIAMFGIALQSDQPNIFNYKQALENQYSSWEQELTAREQAVREKERELDLDGLDSE